MYYGWEQWLIIFFLYSFVGWIWESAYVSARQRSWINRGFLNGPILPIYGFGAAVILFFTLKFEKNIFLVFVLGSFGATTLEFVTGYLMEQIFKVRYWDYSQRRFNLCGYISLYASVGWGIFSIVLVKFVHPFVDVAVRNIPLAVLKPIGNIFMVVFVADTVLSVRNALDMKELLAKVSESNRLVSSMKNRLESSAGAVKGRTFGAAQYLKEFEEDWHSLKEKWRQKAGEYANKPRLLSLKLRENREEKSSILEIIYKKIDRAVDEAFFELQNSEDESVRKKITDNIKILNDIKHDIKRIEINVLAGKSKDYLRAARIFKRNPSSVSNRFKDSFSEIKDLFSRRGR